MSRFAALLTAFVSLCIACAGCNSPSAASGTSAASAAYDLDERRTLAFLASDPLEGRAPGTKGLDRAAAYIAQQFESIGLRPLPGQEDYFQPFEMTTATEVGPNTALRVGDESFEQGEDFSPIGLSGQGPFEGDVVFAGYGIESDKHDYDDYAGIDVKGKVVLAMRYEPHDHQGNSKFDPRDWSDAAALTEKARRAREAGAAALLLVTPPDIRKDDQLLGLSGRVGSGKDAIPVLHVKRTVAEELLRRGGSDADLKTLQEKIDHSTKPASIELNDVRVAGNVDLQQKKVAVKNVVGYLPGQNADEYVVVGAHYDHLGRGGGLSSLWRRRGEPQIHNGADDNASGTTAMLSMAAQMAQGERPQRSIIFAAFTAEEQGLLGSMHFVEHSPVPLEQIVAMLNLDMVGRVRTAAEHAPVSATHPTTTTTTATATNAEATTQDASAGVLYVGGAGTAENFDAIVKRADRRSPLVIRDLGRGGIGPSDHMSFALKKIPVLFLFSGLHGDYHRPTDDAEKINYEGLAEVIDFAGDVVDQIAAAPRQQYVDASDASPMRVGGTGQRSRVTLGVMPDYSSFGQGGGVKISETIPNSPAAKAGLQPNDVLVKVDEKTIDTLYDLTDVLARGKSGQKVKLYVLRGDSKTPIELEATLAERKD